MADKEKIRAQADIALEKAELLFDKDRLKKAAEMFTKAAKLYAELELWRVSEKCLLFASKAYHKSGTAKDLHNASISERLAGQYCILEENYEKARDYLDIAAKSILRSGSKNGDNEAADLFGLAFCAYLIQGRLDDAITYVKRFKQDISPDTFQNNDIVQAVRNITKAKINRKEEYIKDTLKRLNSFNLNAVEIKLMKNTVNVVLLDLMLDSSLQNTAPEYIQEDLIQVEVTVKLTKVNEFRSYGIEPNQFETILLEKVEYLHSDNVSLKDKADLPMKIDNQSFKEERMHLSYRSSYPGEASIGPLSFTFLVDGKFRFKQESNVIRTKITSPDAMLGIHLKPQKTPIINQTFPVEVEMSNKSEGNAMKIEVEFEFPEDLRMMRGTMQKQIYSLSPNENIKWEIHLKAFDIGSIPITVKIQFLDGDGNLKGPFTAELPIEINM